MVDVTVKLFWPPIKDKKGDALLQVNKGVCFGQEAK